MTTVVMIGKYSADAIREISPNRTEKAISLIKELGGKLHSMYALLGGYDVVLIVEFPKLETAMKASLALSLLTGISFSSFPAISVDDFDKMIGR